MQYNYSKTTHICKLLDKALQNFTFQSENLEISVIF